MVRPTNIAASGGVASALAASCRIRGVLSYLLDGQSFRSSEKRRALKRIFAAAVFAFVVDVVPAHGEDLSRREALELQKACGLQAAKAFKQAGWKVGEPTNGSTANFESHLQSRDEQMLHADAHTYGIADDGD
jgi:hypothetical protein